MRLDLSDLHLFLCIVEAGSITQGAMNAHLALGSASERLRRIEADVEVKLLERHPRGVMPTEAGEALAHHARQMLLQHKKMRGELEAFAKGLSGTLRLHANTAALASFLPRKLAPWLQAHPSLHMDVKERTSLAIIQSIQAGIVEGGIITDAANAEGLKRDALVPDHLVVVVAKGHPLSSQSWISFHEVVGLPMVGLSEESALQAQIEEQARQLGASLTLRIRMKGFGELCNLVAHQVGIAIIPKGIAQQWLQRYDLSVVNLNDPWAKRQLCLCYRDEASLSPAMQSLFTHLRLP
ncbi:LysR family transcriptional regulator [Vreelandella alkaliphila]|uniref:LysR family transcriptional regulator n=1 Tax=Vreelandella alkaliphila TaxID=272774 RepID=A0ABX4HDE9_9GAMM|nr:MULTISPECIES: LysR family transcriptional regulator [Halomonas]MCD6006416.1 LysR family transcriptional regulator [Halomonas sp. IOP_6]PAU70438.1 LysR family transcriptional regulator [Halomonas humidisoli]